MFSKVALYALLLAPAAAIPSVFKRQSDLDAFITAERAISLQGALANIGSTGLLAPGADPGIVIASPSMVNPDYFYTWTRDSALTFTMLIDEFIEGNTSLQSHISDYISAQAILQTVTNPSGGLLPVGLGLGEPKFYVNETRFNSVWGRPQRDGPALRAIALMNYIGWLVQNGQESSAKTVVWPVVMNDLDYVAQYWNQTTYDLWEEVSGSSFFTTQNQYRALVQGAQVAQQLGETCSNCVSQAPEVLCFLQSFWNSTGGYIIANINTDTVRSGVDSNTVLGPIHVFDINASCSSIDFQPCNNKSLSNLKVLVDSFRSLDYPINSGIPAGQAIAIGRYPEDTYYDGNPWYLCTLAVAELLYDAVAQFNRSQSIVVDETSLGFFQEIYPEVAVQQYNSGSTESTFAEILNSMTTYADGFVAVVEKYIPSNGSISEEYNKTSGMPTSAYDLTWSFASFVTMAERRSGQYSESWGSPNATTIPATCAGTSAPGSYAPALAAGAPNVSEACMSPVLFEVNATTVYGENLYITGNDSALGDYTPIDPMNSGNYTSARPEWYLEIYLPASTMVQYQYVRQESNGTYIYETINRTVTVPACGGNVVTTNDIWTGPT